MDPPDGIVNISSLAQGSTATYSCDEGYTLIGDSNRTCESTAAWTGNEPTCRSMYLIIVSAIDHCHSLTHYLSLLYAVINCGIPPTLANGHFVFSAPIFGEVVTYMCNDGYQFTTASDSPRQRECLSSEMWSNASLECEQGMKPQCVAHFEVTVLSCCVMYISENEVLEYLLVKSKAIKCKTCFAKCAHVPHCKYMCISECRCLVMC